MTEKELQHYEDLDEISRQLDISSRKVNRMKDEFVGFPHTPRPAVQQTTNATAEICSDSICAYCENINSDKCGGCDEGVPGAHYAFKGRKLSPVA